MLKDFDSRMIVSVETGPGMTRKTHLADGSYVLETWTEIDGLYSSSISWIRSPDGTE